MRPTARLRSTRSVPTFRAITALILREMETTYGRSPGGYLWAFVDPVAGIALLTLVFSLLLRSPSLGTNFALFYSTGIVVFTGYNALSGAVSSALRYSKALLQYPAVTFMDAILARFLLNLLTQMAVGALIVYGIIWFYELNPIIRWEPIMLATAMSASLAMGIGLFNCYLFLRFQVWQRIWSILNRPLFILSGIIFIPEDVGGRSAELLMINPLTHITSEMRKGFYGTYEAALVNPTYVFAWALGFGVAGMFLLSYHYQDAMNR
ncbi:ABC transporter permease [Palleronia rufa]|uniref:ABC transporter permease n=1 Tax=Palleronia rufa TaxID=1530186 RepID=UPI0006906416|nr:ABC transporter permease [Palleronia rufa]